MSDNMREQIAAMQHDFWGNWMRWLFNVSVSNDDGTVTIPATLVERWQRQINTLYYKLSENEKDSDRELAKIMISIMFYHDNSSGGCYCEDKCQCAENDIPLDKNVYE